MGNLIGLVSLNVCLDYEQKIFFSVVLGTEELFLWKACCTYDQ